MKYALIKLGSALTSNQANMPSEEHYMHSHYDGTHVSVDVRARGVKELNAKASQDRTGDGWKDFFASKPR